MRTPEQTQKLRSQIQVFIDKKNDIEREEGYDGDEIEDFQKDFLAALNNSELQPVDDALFEKIKGVLNSNTQCCNHQFYFELESISDEIRSNPENFNGNFLHKACVFALSCAREDDLGIFSLLHGSLYPEKSFFHLIPNAFLDEKEFSLMKAFDSIELSQEACSAIAKSSLCDFVAKNDNVEIKIRARGRLFNLIETSVKVCVNKEEKKNLAAIIPNLWDFYTKIDELELYKNQEIQEKLLNEVEKFFLKLSAEEINKIQDLDKESLKNCLVFVSRNATLFSKLLPESQNENNTLLNFMIDHKDNEKFSIWLETSSRVSRTTFDKFSEQQKEFIKRLYFPIKVRNFFCCNNDNPKKLVDDANKVSDLLGDELSTVFIYKQSRNSFTMPDGGEKYYGESGLCYAPKDFTNEDDLKLFTIGEKKPGDTATDRIVLITLTQNLLRAKSLGFDIKELSDIKLVKYLTQDIPVKTPENEKEENILKSFEDIKAKIEQFGLKHTVGVYEILLGTLQNNTLEDDLEDRLKTTKEDFKQEDFKEQAQVPVAFDPLAMGQVPTGAAKRTAATDNGQPALKRHKKEEGFVLNR